MQKDFSSPLKNTFIEYVKSHSKYDGEIMDIFNHIEEANKAFQSLPFNMQNELGQIILNTLAANGIITISLKR